MTAIRALSEDCARIARDIAWPTSGEPIATVHDDAELVTMVREVSVDADYLRLLVADLSAVAQPGRRRTRVAFVSGLLIDARYAATLPTLAAEQIAQAPEAAELDVLFGLIRKHHVRWTEGRRTSAIAYFRPVIVHDSVRGRGFAQRLVAETIKALVFARAEVSVLTVPSSDGWDRAGRRSQRPLAGGAAAAWGAVGFRRRAGGIWTLPSDELATNYW